MRNRLALALVVSAVAACRPSGFDRPSGWTELDGWVEHVAVAVRVQGRLTAAQGAQPWIIVDGDGRSWIPMAVPESFQLAGLGVEADVRLRPDLLSVGLEGELVEVLRIRESSRDASTVLDEDASAPATLSGDPGPTRSALWGEWRIIGHLSPGVAAMSSARAGSWTGRALEFGPSTARSPNGECLEPAYRERTAMSDAVFSGEYGVPIESVPPAEGIDTLLVVDVRCSGAGWDAAGTVVLVLDERRALAPWDGVMFELRRSR